MSKTSKITKMSKKERRRQRQLRKIRKMAGIAVAAMIVITLAAANLLAQLVAPKAAPASREVEILAAPQTLPQAVQDDNAVTTSLMTPPPVMPTAAPTAVPTAAPTPEPTFAPLEADEPFEYLPVVQQVSTSEKKIAITVDDCFQTDNLRYLCQGTLKCGGKLTIFPIGELLARDSLQAVLREYVLKHGFQVENHTYSHSRVFRLPEDEMAAEIWRQRDAVNQALGVNYQQSFFRLMGGDGKHDQRTHNYLKQLGFRGIADWSLSGSDASMEQIKQHLQPGAVYLFHTTDADTAKLEKFIPYAVSMGYEIVTLNELMGLPANTWTDLSTAETSAPAPLAYETDYRAQQVGDYSWTVVQIQTRLMELGYLNGNSDSALNNTAADGVYGNGTAKAISNFQSAMGLPATGIADEATQKALFNVA